MNLRAELVLVVLLAAVPATVLAAGPASLVLCSARAGGNYHAAAHDMAASADAELLVVTVVETAGSQDNLERMAAGECDAAIVQTDAYLVYQAEHREQRLEVTRNRHLFAEYAHLVCRRDAGISTFTRLLSAGSARLVATDAESSGSALTWHVFASLQPALHEVRTQPVGGDDALQAVLDGAAHCLFFVSSFASEFGRLVDERGHDLQLVPLADEPMRSATLGGTPLYEARQVSGGIYPNLTEPYGVETLAVGATLITRRAWARQHPNGEPALIRAMNDAAPNFRARSLER